MYKRTSGDIRKKASEVKVIPSMATECIHDQRCNVEQSDCNGHFVMKHD